MATKKRKRFFVKWEESHAACVLAENREAAVQKAVNFQDNYGHSCYNETLDVCDVRELTEEDDLEYYYSFYAWEDENMEEQFKEKKDVKRRIFHENN